jgi:single-strand selective monofunctional uracil DNA glycosylase
LNYPFAVGVAAPRDPVLLLIRAARALRVAAGRLTFSEPVACVYNPLSYAWAAHEQYLRRFGNCPKRVVFLGMNPGPFGMVQTGVPFGEVAAVRDWLQIQAKIRKPAREHPRRPVTGFDCARSEVSGQRLWGLFAERFGAAPNFFLEHIVINYCPLAFVEVSGRNRTPDKLPRPEREALFAICDDHLRAVITALQPDWLVGIGEFAAERARVVVEDRIVKIAQILHPSPASPLANRDWNGTVTRQLEELGGWSGRVGPERGCCNPQQTLA